MEMGESTCLLQPSFSTQLRDPLSGSISFGRFMCDSDSLALDKWSNLSHKRYVEEAAKYSKPGSVAQKKAFFEDYYKKKALLAQENAAAAAAALATSTQNEQSSLCNIGDSCLTGTKDEAVSVIEIHNKGIASDVSCDEASAADLPVLENPEQEVFPEHSFTEAIESNKIEPPNVCQPEIPKADPELSTATTELSEDSQMEKPLLKDRNTNEEVSSSVRKPRPQPVPSLKPVANLWPSAKSTPCPPPKPANRSRKENVTPTNNISLAMESIERIRKSPKPLFSYMSRTPARDATRCTANPLRTPSVAHQAKKSIVTPKSENRRNITQLESATPGNRTTGAKWRYFGGLENKSRPSPTASIPFTFRTEERAVKRKEKLELKFDAKAPQKVQLQTKIKEKAECELKKLRQSLCFRARPLPSFYKERKTLKDDITSANPAEAPRPSNLQQTRKITKDVREGSSSSSSTLPPPPPLPKTERPSSLHKNKATNVSGANKSNSKGLTHPRSLAAMISNDNNSPK